MFVTHHIFCYQKCIFSKRFKNPPELWFTLWRIFFLPVSSKAGKLTQGKAGVMPFFLPCFAMVELIFLSHPLGILARLGHKNTLDPPDVSSLYIFHSVISACSWWWQGWVRRADPTEHSGVWFLLNNKYQCLEIIGNRDDVVKAVKPSALDSYGGAVTASFFDLGTSLTCCASW